MTLDDYMELLLNSKEQQEKFEFCNDKDDFCVMIYGSADLGIDPKCEDFMQDDDCKTAFSELSPSDQSKLKNCHGGLIISVQHGNVEWDFYDTQEQMENSWYNTRLKIDRGQTM